MRAIRVHEYGGPEKLLYEEIPKPAPKAGEAHRALEGRQTSGKALLIP